MVLEYNVRTETGPMMEVSRELHWLPPLVTSPLPPSPLWECLLQEDSRSQFSVISSDGTSVSVGGTSRLEAWEIFPFLQGFGDE